MRIHRVALRNFRGIRQAEVLLGAPGVTIVQGPNEVGKSSLAEALDMVFDKLDSSRDKAVQAVKPVDVDAGPEVEVELSTGPYRAVYAKRWLKDARTTLRLLEPSPANLTGREAHERMRAILEETVDLHLWRALRHEQGVALAQAAVKDTSLGAALDAVASGPGLLDPAATVLWEAARAERERYVTPKEGRPTKEREQAKRELEGLRSEVAELEQELGRLEQMVLDHERLGQERKALEDDLAQRRGEVNRLAALVAELERREQGVQLLESQKERAASELEVARQHAEARRERVRAVEEAKTRVARLRAGLEELAPALDAAEKAQEEAAEALERARRERDAAERREILARGDREYLRQRFDLELLSERAERVRKANEEVASARALLESSRLTAEELSEIEAASEAVRLARARLEAAGGSVRVRAEADVEFELGGERVGLRAGEDVVRDVGLGLELRFSGLATVDVKGASGDLSGELGSAEAELARLRAVYGLEDPDPVAQARELVRRRDEAERALQHWESVVRDNLRDLSEERLADLVRSLAASVEAYPNERRADGPLPSDLEVAEREEREASEALEEARRRLALAEREDERAREELARRRDEGALHRAELELAERDLASATGRLEAERAEKADQDLEDALARAEEAFRTAQASWQDAKAALDREDPDGARVQLRNQQDLLNRCADELDEVSAELQRTEGSLKVKGEEGLHDRLEEARGRLEAAERDFGRLERRAKAAELLFEVLDRRRAEAKARYVGPLRDEIERLGRIVFGPSLSVELDPDSFQVARRTLEGVTLPYESLSTGAKEQLCLLGRLACARIVARAGGAKGPAGAGDADGTGGRPSAPGAPGQEDGGVPVVIDDALGYSDPERLERLGAVLAHAGRDIQVLVLTCVPERYRAVGSAKVVRLEPSEVGGPAPPGFVEPAPRTSPTAAPGGEAEPPRRRAAKPGPREAAEVILRCLEEAGAPLGKSQVLERTRLPAAQWTPTIRYLLDEGLVVQEGKNKGARYRPAPTPAAPAGQGA